METFYSAKIVIFFRILLLFREKISGAIKGLREMWLSFLKFAFDILIF